jgi:hypothetical protein
LQERIQGEDKVRQIELTSKLVLALIAVVVASAMVSAPVIAQQGGGGPTPRANSVTSATIIDGEVNTQDLANNAVTSAKIEDGTIQEEDIAEGVIPEPNGGGGGGGTVTLDTNRIEGQSIPIAPNAEGTAVADCPDGQVITGGGYVVLEGTTTEGTTVTANTQAADDTNRWQVTARAPSDNGSGLIAIAICIDSTLTVTPTTTTSATTEEETE